MLVNTDTLAQALDVTPRRIQQLAKEGLPIVTKGKWNLIICLHWYIRRLRSASQGVSASDARARYENHRADMAQLELEERQGLMIPAKKITQDLCRIMAELKVVLLGLPGRLANDFPDPRKAKKVLDKELRSALNQVAVELEKYGNEV